MIGNRNDYHGFIPANTGSYSAYATNFSITGEEVDASAKLLRMLSVSEGKSAVFTNNVLNVGSVVALTGCSLIPNGVIFNDIENTPSNTIFFTLGEYGRVAGVLRLHYASGNSRDRVFRDSNYCHIDALEIKSVDQIVNRGDSLDGAVQLRSHGARLGSVNVSSFDNSLVMYAATDTVVNSISLTDYVRGVYIKGCTDIVINRFLAKSKSPNAGTLPGHNALLISDNNNISFGDVHIEDAGEHGIRVSGTNDSRYINIDTIRVIRSGKNGLKIRPDTGAFVKFFRANSIYSIDNGSGTLGENENGIMIERCAHSSIGYLQVWKDTQSTSGYRGAQFFNVQNFTLESSDIRDTASDAIHITCRSTSDVVSVNIVNATTSNPVVIEVDDAAFMGDGTEAVVISSVVGMVELNGSYLLSQKSSNTYEVQTTDGVNVDGTGYSSYVSGGVLSGNPADYKDTNGLYVTANTGDIGGHAIYIDRSGADIRNLHLEVNCESCDGDFLHVENDTSKNPSVGSSVAQKCYITGTVKNISGSIVAGNGIDDNIRYSITNLTNNLVYTNNAIKTLSTFQGISSITEPTIISIVGGVLDLTAANQAGSNFILVTPETGTTDFVDTISNALNGGVYFFTTNNSHIITYNHKIGNVYLAGEVNTSRNEATDTLLLVEYAGNMCQVGGSDNDT